MASNRNASQNPTEKALATGLSVKSFSSAALKFEEQFSRLLPDNIRKSRILTGNRVVGLLVNLYTTNEDIRACRASTILNAAGLACSVGLEFNNALGQSAIIPYEIHGVPEANWQLMYRGGVTLAMRSGKVQYVQAEVVYEQDDFEFEYGSRAYLRHKPADRFQNDFNFARDWRKAYCLVAFKGGGDPSFLVMDRTAIEEIREKSSKAKDNPKGPWRMWPEAMARKTPIKQELKLLDLTGESSMAAGLDDQAEGEDSQDVVLDWKDYSAEDVDHQTKTQVQGAGASKPHGGGETKSKTDEPPPNSWDEGEATKTTAAPEGPRTPDTVKGPFKQDHFDDAEFAALAAEFKKSGMGANNAQFVAFLGKWAGTKGELVEHIRKSSAT